jgi:hypothetical protein
LSDNGLVHNSISGNQLRTLVAAQQREASDVKARNPQHRHRAIRRLIVAASGRSDAPPGKNPRMPNARHSTRSQPMQRINNCHTKPRRHSWLFLRSSLTIND